MQVAGADARSTTTAARMTGRGQAELFRRRGIEQPAGDLAIGDQIARYEASVWRGVSIGASLPGAALLSGMIALGVWRLARDRSVSQVTRLLIGVWALVVTLSTLLLTPLEWQRYYLPVYPVVGLLGASGLSDLLRRLKR